MKTIQNEETDIRESAESEERLDYAGLIRVCVNRPKQGGFTVDEMRKRQRILDALEGEGDEMEFEDADVKTLKQCVKDMKWAMMHPDIIEFSDYIRDL